MAAAARWVSGRYLEEEAMKIGLLECRFATEGQSNVGVGYGRDVWEARAHAGWEDKHEPTETLNEVVIADGEPVGSLSEQVARAVCTFHVEEDPEVSAALKAEISALLDGGLWASATDACIHRVWDDEEY